MRRRASARLIGLAAAAMVFAATAAAVVLTGRANQAAAEFGLMASLGDAMMALGLGIDQVSLAGQHFTADADIFDALDLTNVKTFAALDAAAALKRIERLPWVDTAQITRVFPGKLQIEVRERRPFAIWDRGGQSYLIDATGRTLGPITGTTNWQLPHVAGEGAPLEASMLFVSLGRHGEIEKKVHHAVRVGERRWSLALDNGSRIELGPDRENEGLELIASSAALKKALDGPASVIDVRTPGRAVIRAISPGAGAAALSAQSG